VKYRVVTRSRGGYAIQFRGWCSPWKTDHSCYYTKKEAAIELAERLANPKPIEVVWESK